MNLICCGMTWRSTAGGCAEDRSSAAIQPVLGATFDTCEGAGDHGFDLGLDLLADQGDFHGQFTHIDGLRGAGACGGEGGIGLNVDGRSSDVNLEIPFSHTCIVGVTPGE